MSAETTCVRCDADTRKAPKSDAIDEASGITSVDGLQAHRSLTSRPSTLCNVLRPARSF